MSSYKRRFKKEVTEIYIKNHKRKQKNLHDNDIIVKKM